MPLFMMLVVVETLDILCPISFSLTKVNAKFKFDNFSQVNQSTLHVKLQMNTSLGVFFLTNVTAGQQIEFPNFNANRFQCLNFPSFLILKGNNNHLFIFKFLFA